MLKKTDTETSFFKDSVQPVIVGVFSVWVVMKIFGIIAYSIELADFNKVKFNVTEHLVIKNGVATYGSMKNVLELEAVMPSSGGGTSTEWCPGYVAKRGYIVMGQVGGTMVCCNAVDGQYLIPSYDEGEARHYLCGKWPHTDHIIKKIAK